MMSNWAVLTAAPNMYFDVLAMNERRQEARERVSTVERVHWFA
jgi:hypothetical protein